MGLKTYAKINLDSLAFNFHEIRKKISSAIVIGVVKADSYGHGAVKVAKRLVKEGCKFFAVAQLKEAMELKESGIKEPILIFGRLFPEHIGRAVNEGFRITLFGVQDIKWIEKANIKKPAFVHVKVDTGMGRVGLLPDQEPDFFNVLTSCSKCKWEGIYSHFSTSDEKDKEYASWQLSRFEGLLADLTQKKQVPQMIHMANSGGILAHPKSYFNAVRPGIILYGYYPSKEVEKSVPLRQVMTFTTYVSHIRNMPENHPISYGRRWKTKNPSRIAVVPVGYADGIRRALTNNGELLIRGKLYPMVGAVTMDQTMVHVDESVETGDEVIIWGDTDKGTIKVMDVAEKIGTIPYEMTCGVSKRVSRKYIN